MNPPPWDPSTPDNCLGGLSPDPPLARPVVASPLDPATPAAHPMLLGSVSPGTCVLDVFLIVAAYMLSQGGAIALIALFTQGDPKIDVRELELGAVVFGGMTAICTAVLLARLRGLTLKSLGLDLTGVEVNIPLGFAVAAVTFAVFLLGVGLAYAVWPGAAEDLANNPKNIQERLPRLGIGGLAGLTAFVGLWEEITFRGFILPRLRRATGTWTLAVLLSSIIFAAPHLAMQSAALLIPLFMIGALWSVVTIWRRSLVPVIVAHFLFNFAQMLYMTQLSPEWD
ncbi:MAG: CPBP family intramembrane metalloprotease [bacterium]|nr:CPBP family intramembrane metalloprotease [bacterium]